MSTDYEPDQVSDTESDDDQLGPIDHIVVHFPDGRVSGEGFDMLLDLVDRRLVRVIDLEFFTKTSNGEVRGVPVDEVAHSDNVDLTEFVGATSNILDATDLSELDDAIDVGGLVAVLVYEELALLPVVRAWARAGAIVLSEGPILPTDLDAALDDAN